MKQVEQQNKIRDIQLEEQKNEASELLKLQEGKEKENESKTNIDSENVNDLTENFQKQLNITSNYYNKNHYEIETEKDKKSWNKEKYYEDNEIEKDEQYQGHYNRHYNSNFKRGGFAQGGGNKGYSHHNKINTNYNHHYDRGNFHNKGEDKGSKDVFSKVLNNLSNQENRKEYYNNYNSSNNREYNKDNKFDRYNNGNTHHENRHNQNYNHDYKKDYDNDYNKYAGNRDKIRNDFFDENFQEQEWDEKLREVDAFFENEYSKPKRNYNHQQREVSAYNNNAYSMNPDYNKNSFYSNNYPYHSNHSNSNSRGGGGNHNYRGGRGGGFKKKW